MKNITKDSISTDQGGLNITDVKISNQVMIKSFIPRKIGLLKFRYPKLDGQPIGNFGSSSGAEIDFWRISNTVLLLFSMDL